MTKSIIILFVFGCLYAQGNLNNQVEGTVTYITLENVYCDLGSKNGLGIGDTLHVYRRNDEIGLLIAQSVGRKSSVTTSLVSADLFQLGDRVIFTPGERKAVVDIIEEQPIVKEEVRLRKPKRKPVFDHGGSISIRANWNQYDGSSKYQRLLGNMNYRLGINFPIKSQFWIYGYDNFTENSFRLYQMRLEIGDRNEKFYSQIGRLYASELAGVGAVDGVMASFGKNAKNRIGAMAGFQPKLLKTEFSSDVKKLSVFSTNEWRVNKQIFKVNAALVGQYADTNVDREFIYFRLLWRTGSNVELSWYETVDIYRDSTLYDRSTIEPLTSQISFRYRMGKKLTFTSRLSSRKQILYRQSGSMLPDSLFVDELRTGWYGSIRLQSEDRGALLISGNLRTQTNSSELSRMITVGYSAPRLKNNLYIRFSSSFIKNMLITGFRNILNASKAFNNKGSMFAEYDLYIYGFGNQLSDYTRHTLSFGLNYRMMKKISTNVTVDLNKDGEFSAVYLFGGISYRF